MYSKEQHGAAHHQHRRLSNQTENDEAVAETQTRREHHGLGVRHIQAFMCFMAIVVGYTLRMNLSVAVVGMTTSVGSKIELTPEKKALVLSSLFWGYGILQVLYGAIGRRGYASRLLALGNFASGIFSLLLPLAAMKFGFVGICVMRVATGLVQGNIYPNLHNVMAKWNIPQERDSVMVIVQAGAPFGTVVAMVASGYLAYHYDWPSIFYTSGLLGIIWGIIHYIVGSEGPEVCKIISYAEREFISQSFKMENKEVDVNKADVPWKSILTSGPVIALSLTAWCAAWGNWTLSSLTPSYVSGVLGFDIQEDGFISALPYLCNCLLAILLSFFSSMINKRSSIPIRILRPVWNTVGMWGSAGSLLVLACCPLNTTAVIILLVIASSVTVANNLGHSITFLDISPNFAGIAMSIANTTANIASIFGPLISTDLIQDNTDVTQWRVVFIVSAVILFLGNCIYLIWGSTNKQPWDEGITGDRESDNVEGTASSA